MSVDGIGVGDTRLARARARQREAMDRLVAELRAKEAAEAEDGSEMEASPYRQAEAIARELHQRR